VSAADVSAPDELQHARLVAEGIAREAGGVLLQGWGTRPAVEFKSEDINLVTAFDRRSEALVVARLAAAFPDDTIVGEEGTQDSGTSGVTWFAWFTWVWTATETPRPRAFEPIRSKPACTS
jgi:myo-inositol-1(or 4)-monophosphatase